MKRIRSEGVDRAMDRQRSKRERQAGIDQARRAKQALRAQAQAEFEAMMEVAR